MRLAEGAWDVPTLHALQREHPMPSRVSTGAFRDVHVARQQLAVEAADRLEYGSGLCWVRDDLQGDALQRQDKYPASLRRGPVGSFDEVEAVLRKAQALGRPPFTRH